MNVWELLIAGGVITAVVKLFEKASFWLLDRIAAKKDKGVKTTDDRLTALENRVDGLTLGERVILQDRIKCIGKGYLKAKEISLEDRADMVMMHDVYHNKLGGNGNLDALMAKIMALPQPEEGVE